MAHSYIARIWEYPPPWSPKDNFYTPCTESYVIYINLWDTINCLYIHYEAILTNFK